MPASSRNGLINLDFSLVPTAARSVAGAFAGDPSLDYAFADPGKKANLHHIMRYYLKLDILSGGSCITTSPDCEGVASWCLSDIRSSWWAKLKAGWLTLPYYGGWHFVRYSQKEDRFFETMKARYAPERYVYLALLAVAPMYQRKGYGRKLLTELVATLEASKLPCYLETQNMKNVNMYRSFGFELVESTAYPPGTGCEVHIMVRPAAA